MHILFLDEKDWGKKVPYTIHYLAEHLSQCGHTVWAIDFDDTWERRSFGDWWSPRRERPVSKILAPVQVISPGFVKVAGLSRLSTLATHTWAMLNFLRHKHVDAIVIYSLSNASQALLCSRLFKVPILFHSIDMLAPLIPHEVLVAPGLALERALIRGSDAVLALTPILGRRARALGARRVEIVPNGINLQRLRPELDTHDLREELGLAPDDRVVVFVGTLIRHTGLDSFLHAFGPLAERGVKFVVVGDDVVTKGKELSRIKALTRELGLAESVIFTGLQPADRVPYYINLADVCVSTYPPSEFSRYNITMKVFEYMACERPTVCFNLEGTRSLVPPGHGVIYVDSFEEMAHQIGYLLDDGDVCHEQGNRARHLMEERFSWSRVTDRMEEVLQDVIASRKAGTRCASVSTPYS